MKLPFKFKDLFLVLGIIVVLGGTVLTIDRAGKIIASKETAKAVEFTGEIEEQKELPLVDISYEEMRVYVFPSGSMAVFKSPQYLQYLNNGTHMIMAIEDGTLKVTVMSNNWDYYTIYCNEDKILFFNRGNTKEKLKKKRDF